MTLKQTIGKIVIKRIPLSPKTFSILRFEFAATRTTIGSALIPSRVAKLRKLKNAKGLSINLGSRDAYADWIPMDVRMQCKQGISWDIRRGLPFAPDSVSRIYASHVFEHLDFKHDLPKLLSSCWRVLSPEGAIRVVVPNAARFMKAYLASDRKQWEALGFEALPADMPTPMCLVNHVFHQDGEHQFGYDYETMQWALATAGFKSIAESAYRTSLVFPDELDLSCHAPYSLYVEARKQ